MQYVRETIPIPLIELFIIGIVVVILIKLATRSSRKRKRYYNDHAAAVAGQKFQPKPLMNLSEYRLYCRLERWVGKKGNKCRLFAQVSLGEILQIENYNAFRAINAKRCDFLIIDWRGLPVIVIEYQGRGHFQNHASERDAIKRTAVESAGIAFVEVFHNYDWNIVQTQLEQALYPNREA